MPAPTPMPAPAPTPTPTPTPAPQATKLRAGIRLVQRQKELKSAWLIRFGTSAELLRETMRADVSIAKLQKELGLKAALLEMERIYLTLESYAPTAEI